MDKVSASEIRFEAETAAGSGNLDGKTLTQVTVIGSILAALAASSCCVIPFLLFSLGISGAWISRLTALAPYQSYFAGASLLLLAAGIALIRRRTRTCTADGYCASTTSSRFATFGLWTSGLIIALALAFPYLAALLGDS